MPRISRYDAMREDITQNLTDVFAQSTVNDIRDGIAWYAKARAGVDAWADAFELTPAVVAAVIAALSPQCSWTQNLIAALALLKGQPIPHGPLHVNVAKARAILRDRNPDITQYFKSAPKVESFARNLSGQLDAVTVDTHAYQAGLNDVYATVYSKRRVYETFADCYRDAARAAGLAPCEFQVIIWLTWKRLYPWTAKQQLRKADNQRRERLALARQQRQQRNARKGKRK